MTGWFIRLELVDPVPTDQLTDVRQQLLDTLADAGWPAKSTTASWDLVELSRRPVEVFQQVRPLADTRKRKLA